MNIGLCYFDIVYFARGSIWLYRLRYQISPNRRRLKHFPFLSKVARIKHLPLWSISYESEQQCQLCENLNNKKSENTDEYYPIFLIQKSETNTSDTLDINDGEYYYLPLWSIPYESEQQCQPCENLNNKKSENTDEYYPIFLIQKSETNTSDTLDINDGEY